MSFYAGWLRDLNSPTALVGFVLLLITIVTSLLIRSEKWSSKSKDRLFKNFLYSFLIICFLGILLTFALFENKGAVLAAPHPSTSESSSSAIDGEDAKAAPSREKTSSSNTQGAPNGKLREPKAGSSHINQKSSGNSSPNINSGGDVNVSY